MAVHRGLFLSAITQITVIVHGGPTRGPGRIVQCDPNTNQTLLLVGNCIDYNEKEDVVFIGACPYINRQKGVVDEVYVTPPCKECF